MSGGIGFWIDSLIFVLVIFTILAAINRYTRKGK